MAAGTSCIRLTIVMILFFSYLVCMNEAVPITRSSNMVHRPHPQEVLPKRVLRLENTDFVMRRILGMELNDYPGSGANNRHTPRPQLGRGCIDC